MDALKLCRNILQVISSALLIWQLWKAMTKYLSNLKIISESFKPFKNVSPPSIILCQESQYDWLTAQKLGYHLQSDYLKGVFLEKNGITWGGKENLSFKQSSELLYKAKLDDIYFNHIEEKEYKFILPHGHCWNLKNITFNPTETTVPRIQIENTKCLLLIQQCLLNTKYMSPLWLGTL